MSLISRPIASLGRESPSEVFRRTGINYDYALGSVGLFAANSREFPYSRSTAPFRKDQFHLRFRREATKDGIDA